MLEVARGLGSWALGTRIHGLIIRRALFWGGGGGVYSWGGGLFLEYYGTQHFLLEIHKNLIDETGSIINVSPYAPHGKQTSKHECLYTQPF